MDLQTKLLEKYRALNTIHGVMLEVTHRCPCNCVHCYQARNHDDELSLDEISDLFTQLREEGTINIGISGGEPFMRKDIAGILGSAKKNGFFISILTTGVLIDRAEADMLEQLHVFNAEISLLGATPETHDTLMKHPGAFDRMLRAVSLLREKQINVALKSTIMRGNFRELSEMAALCERLHVPFQANLMVSPRVDGDPAPLALALSREEIATLDREFLTGGLIPGEDMKGGAMLTCNAGKNTAGISPQGDIYPCILMRKKIGSMRERTLRDIWHDHPDPFLATLRAIKPEDVVECVTCELRTHCRRCPGVTYLETGSPSGKSPSACHCARGILDGIRPAS